MQYVFLPFDLGMAALLLWVVGTFAYCLATETGSMWQRLLAAARDSATIVWSKLVIGAASAIGLIVQLADAVNQPDVAAKIQQFLSPQVVAGLFVATMLITVLARKRSL